MTGKKPPAAKVEPATPTPPKPTAKPKVTPPATPPPEPINYEAMAEAAGRGAAAAMAKANEKKTPGAAGEVELNDKQKRTMEVLTRMEQEYPANKGKAKEYAESVRKVEAYKKSWEAQNPGEIFNADDDQHNAFFEANEIDWDEDEYADTMALIRAEKVAEKTSAKLTPKLQEIDRREQLRQAEPAVMGQQIQAARSFWKELGDDFAKVLDEHGNIALPEVERLRAEDPTRDIAFKAATNVESFAAELHRLTMQDSEGKALYPFNDRNPAHIFIADFISDKEAAMQALPVEQQLDGQGRRFATAEEYHAMTPHRQKYYWRFTDADLSSIYASQQADEVKAMLARENEKFEKTASARGYSKSNGAGSPAATQAAAAAAHSTNTGSKPSSPAGTVEPRLAPNQSRNGKGDESATSSFANRWLGRS